MSAPFFRSREAIHAYHCFLDCDTVVFVEGNRGIDGPDMETCSPDEYFWQGILEHELGGRSVRAWSVGSSSEVEKLATRAGSCSRSTLFAVDADVFGPGSGAKTPPFVMRTWGYSWENELLHPDVICAVLQVLCRPADSSQVRAQVEGTIEQHLKDLRWLVHADLLCVQTGKGLFNRASVRQNIRSNGRIDRKRLRREYSRRVRKRRRTKFRWVWARQVEPVRDIYGHLAEELFYDLVCGQVRRAKSQVPSRDDSLTAGIATIRLLASAGKLAHSSYYTEEVLRVLMLPDAAA